MATWKTRMHGSRTLQARWRAREKGGAGLSLATLMLIAPLAMGASECTLVVPDDDDECGDDAKCASADCVYEGQRYSSGESFPSADGCNTCTCTDDGVACTERACLDGCGGLQGPSCPEGQYCDYPPEASCGKADQTGTCAPMPQACDTQYDPVCGCDGKTYGNACEAASAGVSVSARGECGSASSCEHEGKTYAVGESFPAGDGCNTCSCDEDGGVRCSLAYCNPVCGGFAGIACPDGSYCSYPPEAQCGHADQTGICDFKPEGCTLEYDPVCGCDGKTYGNACAAASAGVSVAGKGTCEGEGTCKASAAMGIFGKDLIDPYDCSTCYCTEDGQVVCTEKVCTKACGGWSGNTCSEDEYCEYLQGAACGIADGGGFCRPRPEVCPEVIDPFKACDGKTYTNVCEAAKAGAGVSR